MPKTSPMKLTPSSGLIKLDLRNFNGASSIANEVVSDQNALHKNDRLHIL